jgi:hypothetical protein
MPKKVKVKLGGHGGCAAVSKKGLLDLYRG